LKNHLRTHAGEITYSCIECDYRCSTASSLKQHMRKHSSNKPYKSPACNYKSSGSGNLKRHMMTEEKQHLKYIQSHDIEME